MTTLKSELDEAVVQLNDHYDELVAAARQRLGSLFHAGDYPDSLIGMFDLVWDYPSVEPPDYLRQLKPQLYEQESICSISISNSFGRYPRSGLTMRS